MSLFTLSKERQIKRPIAYILLIAVALAQSIIAIAEDIPWQLEKQEREISVYTGQIDDSPYLAVKATVQINTPITHLSQFMGDGSSCAQWRVMCKSSQVIDTVSEDDRYVYMVLDLPWPASDRDLVLRTTTSVDPESRTATINLRSESLRHPSQNHVRAESRGKIVLQAVDQNKVAFTYIMHTDLGGELPADLVNRQLIESTVDDLNRLKQLAEG